MIFGAVKPRPYFSYAIFVATFTILEARTSPYESFQCAQTATVPDTISPIPPHLLFPPYVLTINDLWLVKIRSSLPLTNSENYLYYCFSDIYVISSYFL